MKKFALLSMVLIAAISLQAQWNIDPVNNTTIANCNSGDCDIYVSTDETSGNTFIQWTGNASNGCSPTLQCVNVSGIPQWGENGIHINSHNFPDMSLGISMVATTDNACVTCFSNYDGECIAIKINADGSFPWGEQGISVFDFPSGSAGCMTTQLIAGTDGGVWALTDDSMSTFVRYINANGNLNPTITISDAENRCKAGKMILGIDNMVFVSYQKYADGSMATNEEIWVEGYHIDGSSATLPTQLMTSTLIDFAYVHDVTPDSKNGGYVTFYYYSFIDNSYDIHIFHFDANGNSTISNPNGASVHLFDPTHNYLNSYATVDPISNDLIITYKKTNPLNEDEDCLYINRITENGERVWDDGILIGDYDGKGYSSKKVDIFPDGSGFMVSFYHGIVEDDEMPLKAMGFDMDGNSIWNTTMSTDLYRITDAKNNSGFHNGQNIIVWIAPSKGKIMGQNINQYGEIGPTSQHIVDNNPTDAEIEILQVFTLSGQSIRCNDLEKLSNGLYIVKGKTHDGQIICKKILISNR